MLKTMTVRATIAAILAGLSMSAHAIADTQRIDIPAGSLLTALETLAKQANVDLVYQDAQVKGLRTGGVAGELSPHDAVVKLLQGTPLKIRRDEASGAILIMVPASSAPTTSSLSPEVRGTVGEGSMPAGDERKSFWSRLRLAQSDTPSPSQGEGRGEDRHQGMEDPAQSSQKKTELEEITVTGTHIRGGTSPSPVITIGSEDIREQGFTDLGQVIRSIPQNFAGGQNPGVAAGAETGPAGIANRDVTGGASLNLRGLGPDASLTLLNGRRLAYGGYVQTVDISAIPVEAVDRIEIVADGASAIYGSDAVGGVANVILRRDYEGATIGALYGGTADGGMTTRQYNATAGTTWSSGGLIATYKYASVDPIRADQRDYTAHMPPPTTIYPGSTLRSELFSAHQSLGDAVELRLDALRTGREQLSYSYYSGVSSFYSRFSPETTTTLVAPALEMSLPNDWRLSLGASWGRDERTLQEFRISTTTGEGARSPYDDCFCNRSRTYEVGAEGPLLHLGGGDARLAVGAGYRWNGFADRLLTTGDNLIEGAEGSRFAYAELGMPLLGGAPGAARESARLSLTAALRREDYDSFGSVVTPKLGLVYDPTGDYTLKASWGRSFKAPTLLQRYQGKGAVLDSAAYYGGDPNQTVLGTFGGNPDLEPERANTRTASLAVHPRALPAFEAELTLFDIDYTDRVVQPIGNYDEALTNPVYSRYVDLSPTPEEQARLIDSAAAGFYNYTGSAYDPGKVVALLYSHFVNVARQRIHGLDLSGSYGFDIGAGRLTFRGSGSWLDSTQKNSPEDSAFDLAGTLYSPAKVNSRVGLVWLQGGLTASAFANYTSGVTDTLTGTRTASFSTVDVSLRYSLDDSAGSRSGWDFALSVQNLFDRPPPFHPTIDPTRVPYDSTNYSAIGRYLTASIARRF